MKRNRGGAGFMKSPLRLLHGIGQDCLHICRKPDYPLLERSDIFP